MELYNFELCSEIINDTMQGRKRIAEIYEYMKKETQLKEKLDLSKVKVRSNGRYYIRIDDRQYTAASYKDLINKLYPLYFGIYTRTLTDLFPEWMRYRRDVEKTCSKTMKENYFIWKSLFADAKIVKIPITTLTARDFQEFFLTLIAEKELTRKRFNDGKSVLNGIYYYAIQKGIVDINPIQHINCNAFKYKPENRNANIYSFEERKKLLSYLRTIEDSSLYALAIQFDFHIIARIGELKALKWSDIDWNKGVIRIQSQLVERQKMNNNLSFTTCKQTNVYYLKGRTNAGYRNMPLTPEAKRILEKARQLNPTGEYIFMPNQNEMSTVTFNRYLKKYCEAVKIPYRSSHQIRFTVASLLYHKHQVDAPTLQGLLGHSTLNMTLHYLKPLDDVDSIMETMSKVLDF